MIATERRDSSPGENVSPNDYERKLRGKVTFTERPLRTQNLDQKSNLVTDGVRLLDGVFDLLAEEASKSLAHAMNGDLDGTFCHLQFGGQMAIGVRRTACRSPARTEFKKKQWPPSGAAT